MGRTTTYKGTDVITYRILIHPYSKYCYLGSDMFPSINLSPGHAAFLKSALLCPVMLCSALLWHKGGVLNIVSQHIMRVQDEYHGCPVGWLIQSKSFSRTRTLLYLCASCRLGVLYLHLQLCLLPPPHLHGNV